MSCRIASPIESRLGDVNYTSGGTPLINDIRPVRQDNIRPAPRLSSMPAQDGADEKEEEVCDMHSLMY